ncbi:uncharacterized protein EV420DRAFT_1481246 [Desarmillaria tabescens]|uniref:Uncharacterized protein n=1 Tax=Armillaria tabescens TaxID=1929756 RepID=A0AA39K8G7_ARMTA|nr:uncharacterized protein EV420DRAFT_1481246 [Desarmillaria tabescens]KAK0455370.1 hypothetical protein EV420DRAFT_1481246 [Desarmillaria tabescens]
MNPQQDTSLPSDSTQACHSPQGKGFECLYPASKTSPQRMMVSLHSKTWKGKMTAGVKKLGLSFMKKTSDDSASLQTMTATISESSYTYEKPEGSTLMSLEEESSQTEAMKYALEVQHQRQLKESGSDQMPGIRWGIPQSQESQALGPRPAPLAGYSGTQQTEPNKSMGSTLHDIIRRRSLAQVDTFQTLQSNLTPESSQNGQKRNVVPQPEKLSLSQTSDTSQTPPAGAETPYYYDDDPWGEHPQTESPQPERRVFFADGGPKDDTIIWWFTGAHSLAGTTDVPNPVEEELNQADHNDWPHCQIWPEPDITKLGLTQTSNPSFTQNPPSRSSHPLYHKGSFSGGSTRERTSISSSKNIEDTSHMSGTGIRYGSTEIPISYNMNPSSTQPIIQTDWTRGLEPGYKSTGSPVWENTQMNPPSTMKATSSFKDLVPVPTAEELYRMNWDQFWWHIHDSLPLETYWSTTPQGQAYQRAEPGSLLERDILLHKTQYAAIN